MLVPRSLLPSALLIPLLAFGAGAASSQSPEQGPPPEDECACACTDEPLTLTDVLSREGQAFFDELSQFAHEATRAELWELLDRCGREMPRIDDAARWQDHFDERYACMQVVERLLEGATAQEIGRILTTFDRVKPDGHFGYELAEQILDRRLVLAALDLRPAGQAAPPLNPKVELPKAAARASEEIRALWRQHAGLQELYRDYEASLAQSDFDVQSRFPQFRRELADYVAGRVTAAERTIGRYVWGGFCGTGADSLSVPQTKALLLTLLEQGRYELAAGAALSVPRSLFNLPNLPAIVFERVLRAAGLDWEALGAIASAADPWSKPVAIGVYGSERAANVLLAIADLPAAPWAVSETGTQAEDRGYLQEVAEFVDPDGPCERPQIGRRIRSRFERPRRTGPSGVSAGTQARILDLLSARVAPGAGRKEAETAAALLGQLCRRESLPVLRAMLRSDYPAVQEHAYAALQAYGEAPPGFEPAPPVGFQLLAGGGPLSDAEVGYVITFRDGGSLSTGLETDAAGVVHIDRGLFLDPKNPVQSVEFGAGEEEGKRLSGKLAAPRDLDELTVVDMEKAAPRPAYLDGR